MLCVKQRSDFSLNDNNPFLLKAELKYLHIIIQIFFLEKVHKKQTTGGSWNIGTVLLRRLTPEILLNGYSKPRTEVGNLRGVRY